MIKVLFVCLGNICRSPLGEGILKHKVKALGKEDQFLIDSCGTGDYHLGKLPDPGSIKVAREHNIDITDQQARQLQARDLESFDYLIAMDSSNLANMLQLSSQVPTSKATIQLLRDYDPFKNRSADVPDPYCMGYDGFQQVYQIIEECCEVMLEEMLEEMPKRS